MLLGLTSWFAEGGSGVELVEEEVALASAPVVDSPLIMSASMIFRGAVTLPYCSFPSEFSNFSGENI